MTRRYVLLGILALIVLLALLAPIQRSQQSVYDLADVLDPAREARLREISDRSNADRNIPLAVVTINSMAAAGFQAPSLSAFSRSLISRKRGYDELRGKDFHSGALLVYSVGDSAVALQFGDGWNETDVAGIEAEALDTLVDHCNDGRCADGLVAAVELLAERSLDLTVDALSYWDKFLFIEKMTIRDFLSAARNPWVAFGYFKWFIILFVAWEFLLPWRKDQPKLRRGIGLDIFYTVFNYVLFWALLGTAVCETTRLVFNDALYHFFGADNMVAVELNRWPIWSRYLLLLLVIDFSDYWIHRLLHKSDILWEFYKVHHSAQELDVFNAIRLHFVEALTYRVIVFVPVGIIGFAVTDTFFVTAFISLFSLFTHANVKIPLGPLKYLLNNPQMHIWHHGLNVHHRGNVNYGDALSVWDYIFGTAYTSDDCEELQLGIDDIDEYPRTFWGQTLAPFKAYFQPGKAPPLDGPPPK